MADGGVLMDGTGPTVVGAVPAELVAVVERHGQVVAAGDNAATLADMRADRIGQLIGSTRLPGIERVSLCIADAGLVQRAQRLSKVARPAIDDVEPVRQCHQQIAALRRELK